MRVISTNLGEPTKFIWNEKEITTGIYKKPTNGSIYLGKTDVKGDTVSNRKVHGGEFKACYLFSADQYPYWQDLYPHLEWTFGMLGENLTVKGLDEQQLFIGDIYKLGNALVQITQPREPCFKFAYKFGSNAVLQQFINHGFSGTYVKVLEEGDVNIDDTFQLVEHQPNGITVFQLFELLYAENKNKAHIESLLNNNALPENLKKRLTYFLK
ncbi:MOSC domain-containing protein [uncultured Winogradskyella sp.]|uniref:MOSC domain-containing protein n=1 Tax=uncultured Winogradskyella sp. TaxID=395353 RepID=UPI002620C338|nr:MOSC domain-containing protein [uncultured Winogradskyella sp.]